MYATGDGGKAWRAMAARANAEKKEALSAMEQFLARGPVTIQGRTYELRRVPAPVYGDRERTAPAVVQGRAIFSLDHSPQSRVRPADAGPFSRWLHGATAEQFDLLFKDVAQLELHAGQNLTGVARAQALVAEFARACGRAAWEVRWARWDQDPGSGDLSLTFGVLEAWSSQKTEPFGLTNGVNIVLPEDITFDGITLAAGSKIALSKDRKDVSETQMLVCSRLGTQLREAKASLLAEVEKAKSERRQRDQRVADHKHLSDAAETGKSSWLADQVLESGLQ